MSQEEWVFFLAVLTSLASMVIFCITTEAKNLKLILLLSAIGMAGAVTEWKAEEVTNDSVFVMLLLVNFLFFIIACLLLWDRNSK